MKLHLSLIAVILASSDFASAMDATDIFKQALFAEEVEQDKQKAAALYQKIIDDAASQTKIADVARVHLAKIKLETSKAEDAASLLSTVQSSKETWPDLLNVTKPLVEEAQAHRPNSVNNGLEEIFTQLKDKAWNWHGNGDISSDPNGVIRFLANGKIETTRGVDWLAGWKPLGGRRFRITQIQGHFWDHELSADGQTTTALATPGVSDTQKRLSLHPTPSISMDEAEMSYVKKLVQSNPKMIEEWRVALNLAKLNRVKSLTCLFDHGIPVDLRDRWGLKWTPLMFAAAEGQASTVTFLLDKMAQIDATDSQNATPLIIAAAHGNAATLEVLLSRGANLRWNSSALFSQKSDSEIGTALHAAARAGHLAIVERLLSAGSDVNQRSPQSLETPLHIAAAAGNDGVCKLLLEAGANPLLKLADKVGLKSGWTPIHSAAARGADEVIRLFIPQKQPFTVPCGDDGFRRNAFHLAVLQGSISTVKLILSQPEFAGKETRQKLLSTPDLRGNTALHLACSKEASGSAEMVALLMSLNAPLEVQNERGLTPHQMAIDPSQGTLNKEIRALFN